MEHSEIILIALILLIVFAGAQVQKVINLFRKPVAPADLPVPVKTVVSAQKAVETPREAIAPVAKKVSVKKPAAKKPTDKKAAVKKAPVKKTATKKKTTRK